MKTRTLVLAVVVALAVVTPMVFAFLVPGDQARQFRTTAMLLVAAVGILLFVYALFRRFARRGPVAEFWTTLLKAAGFLLVASTSIAEVPLHSTLGMALTFGGIGLLLVGILWGARVQQTRRVGAS